MPGEACVCLMGSLQLPPDSDVGHCPFGGSPNLCCVEVGSPRIVGMADRLVYLVAREVLASQIDAEAAELARHLRLELEEGGIGRVVIAFAVAIEVARHIEVPELHRRLVAQREQALEARGQGTVAQHAVVGGAGIGVAEGCRGGEARQEGISGIDLEGVAVAASVEILEAHGVAALHPIDVDDELVVEPCVVVLSIQLQVVTGYGEVQAGRHAVVPGLFLLERLGLHEGAPAGQQRQVFGQGVRRAVTLAGRGAQGEQRSGCVLQVKARRDETAIERRVVVAQAGHEGELVSGAAGVLRIEARRALVGRGVKRGTEGGAFAVVVVVERCSHGQVVPVGPVGLKHQLGIGVLLLHVVGRVAEAAVGVVPRALEHQGYRGVVFGVEGETVLPLGQITVGVDLDGVVRHGGVSRVVVCHAARALIGQCLHVELADPDGRHVGHAPHAVQLPLLGHVHEAVSVGIVVAPAVVVVQQGRGREAVVEVQRRVGVEFVLEPGVEVGVGAYAIGGLRLAVLYVDLSRGGLVAVLHARSSLRHLYRLHPRAWHIAQGIGQGGPTQVGHILGEELHVGAAQAEQLDLLGARGCIGVAHIDRRIGGERLSQVATGSAQQLVLPDKFGVLGAPRRLGACRSLDGGRLQVTPTPDGVGRFGLGRQAGVGDSQQGQRADIFSLLHHGVWA